MATSDELHQMIEREVMRRPETVTADSIVLWQRLAVELATIIGRSGFDALYARNVHLVRTQYAWLAEGEDPHFGQLKTCLEDLPPDAVAVASVALFTSFIGTLTQLIGGPLTASILQSAWGRETADTAAEGINNEQ